MLRSEKVTLYFPTRSPDGIGMACGLPGPFDGAGVQPVPSGSEDARAFVPSDVAGVPNGELARAVAKLGAGRTVVGFSIAPDSAIASCDVWWGGNARDSDRVRVSVGNPWIGTLESNASDLRVSLPVGIPILPLVTASPAIDATQAFDATVMEIEDSDETDHASFGFPLRLEVWYSDDADTVSYDRVSPSKMSTTIQTLPRTSERGELVAHFAIALLAEVTESSRVYVCTHGRRRIDVHVSADASVDVEMFAIEGMKQVNELATIDTIAALALELDDAGTTSATVASYDVFSFEGNPITILAIDVSPTAEPGALVNAQVKVIAQDY